MRSSLSLLAVSLALGPMVLCANSSAADDPTAAIQGINQSLSTAGEQLRAKQTAQAAATVADARKQYENLKSGTVPASLTSEVETLGTRIAAAERLVDKARGTASVPGSVTPSPAVKPAEPPPENKPASKSTDVPAPKGKEAAPPQSEKPATAEATKPVAMPAVAETAKPPATSTPKPAVKPTTPVAKTKKPARNKRPAAPAAPSFTADVAPILIARCGNCHVRGARGGLSMATFERLEKGSEGGPIIRPGAADGSRMIEVIVSGDMPRGGGKLEPQEFQTLVRWINAGAPFDGSDRAARIDQRGGPNRGMEVARATGNESVMFSRDLAPVLVEQCIDCHGGDQPSGRLSLESFADLLKGGPDGSIISTDKPAESSLLKRLRGNPQERMPKDADPLDKDVIARFETWIKEGARFDGTDVAQPLTVTLEELAAQRMSHTELAAKRLAQARKLWALGLADEPSQVAETDNFLLIGNLSPARMAELSTLSEAERAKIARLLKRPADEPLVKGRLVMFVFKRSFDYSEFVRMVEEREVPSGSAGHARTKGSDLYVCFTVPSDGDEELPARVVEYIAAGYLQNLNGVPPWFASGAARGIAARVEPRNPLVKQWDAALRQPTAAAADDGFVKATVFDDTTSLQAYAFVRSLMTNAGRFSSLLAALADGREFGAAFEQSYRAPARTLVEMWRRQSPPRRS